MTKAPLNDQVTKPSRRTAVVVEGYPRLSDTSVAQELLALQKRGVPFEVWSLRRGLEEGAHPVYRTVSAPVVRLPGRLLRAPFRAVSGLLAVSGLPGFPAAVRQFRRDFARDRSLARMRMFGQALVMANELPADIGHIHAHRLDAPSSVARYAATLRGITWSFSAHGGDIWRIPDWEQREKLADALWGVAGTKEGRDHLAERAPYREHVALAYHGLDLGHIPAPLPPSGRNGSNPADPVRIVSVGSAVARKGYDDLLSALAALPKDLHWRFVHIGDGAQLDALKAQAAREELADKVTFLGARSQPDVLALIREADLFVLPSKAGEGGDRDGLPTALMEAASQGLGIIATRFAAIPEFIADGHEGILVPPGRRDILALAIESLVRNPARRAVLGFAAADRLREDFTSDAGIDVVEARLRAALGLARSFVPVQRDPVP
ncbi:glycosyltransferase family 4 protein [Pseudochelatococcus contaminans]|uniref:Glycosyltransferase involved in cell wall biosynthesis n=1 Tax=Pseudochelatococcus contaminans TaxID=1538103 RepID=A0A7W6EH70_9HYPH|nr:glycosyltransferase family 4 protein [Pseudochelatococcus contaminans]MBB3809557.1 glycosyltransferase involved in cell wall biosynthesis [Pseudochelatococcus contaminans]